MPTVKVTSPKACSHCGKEPNRNHGAHCYMAIAFSGTGPASNADAQKCKLTYPNNAHGGKHVACNDY